MTTKRALVLGAGPTRFGVGHELDHGRIVAVAMLRATGFHVAVLDSNPAVLPQLEADTVYVEPLDISSITAALIREKANTIVPMWGGELAHELTAKLETSGELARLGVTVLGASSAHVAACAKACAGERERFLAERGDRTFTSVEAEFLLEPEREPLLVSAITALDDPAVHPKDAVGVFGAAPNVIAAITSHVTALAAAGGSGSLCVHVAVEYETHALYTLSCAPFPTRVGAVYAHATGYSFAENAMRVALGQPLTDAQRAVLAADGTQGVAVRFPRFVFDTFEHAETTLSAAPTSMGEAVGIGETLGAALLVAARTARPALDGLDPRAAHRKDSLATPHADRVVHVLQAIREGRTEATNLPSSLIAALEAIAKHETLGAAQSLDAAGWRALKRFGFSDAHVATLSHREESVVQAERNACGVDAPSFVRFGGSAGVLWPCWDESVASVPSPKAGGVMLVGSAALRVGHGAHADASALGALAAITGAKTSAPHVALVAARDLSGPLAADTRAQYTYAVSGSEDVAHATAHARPHATLFAFSETPEPLASTRYAATRPASASALGKVQAVERAGSVQYPLIVRTKGRTGISWSTVVTDESALRTVLEERHVEPHEPIRLEHFVSSATEIDVIAITDGTQANILAAAEQVEPAGIHEADSAKVIPPYALAVEIVRKAEDATRAMAIAAKIRGFVCTRFAWDGEKLWLLSASSATPALLPLVSSMFARDYACVATAVMLGASLAEAGMPNEEPSPRRVAVRECILPFRRLTDVDPRLRPDAQSTGNVAGVGTTVARAYAKALRGMGLTLRVPRDDNPKRVAVFAASKRDASASVDVAKRLHALGFDLAATEASAAMFASMRMPHRAFSVADTAALVREIGTTACVAIVTAQTPAEISATEALRHASRIAGIPCFTTMVLARAACAALEEEGLTATVTPIER